MRKELQTNKQTNERAKTQNNPQSQTILEMTSVYSNRDLNYNIRKFENDSKTVLTSEYLLLETGKLF